MGNTPATVPEGQHFILSRVSPGPAQRRLALAVVLALLVAFAIAAGPLSTIQVTRIDAFVPIYATAMLVSDSITAVLLFAQFSILRSRALLVIASGYLFTALMVVDAGSPVGDGLPVSHPEEETRCDRAELTTPRPPPLTPTCTRSTERPC